MASGDSRPRPPAALPRCSRRPIQPARPRSARRHGVARCVSRGEAAPLRPADVAALAPVLQVQQFPPGAVLFGAGLDSGVWIVRDGRVELSTGSGHRRAVVQLLRPGDVNGDSQLLLGMPLPYTARAVTDATCLFMTSEDFAHLLASRPTISRRWLSSVAQRLAMSQGRILGLLGGSPTSQTAMLLTDEAVDGRVELPQRTLAARTWNGRISSRPATE